MQNYAGFWIRFVAYLIDVLLIVVVMSILGGILGFGVTSAFDPAAAAGGGVAPGAGLGYNAISIVIGIAYFAGMESSALQATLGKKAVGLIVVDTQGRRISLGRAIGRYFAKILSGLILAIGYIMIAFTERKQGLHDLIVSTLVVKGAPGESLDTQVFE